MKAKTFENLIRKIVREEIDYALRREIKELKEDLQDTLKPIITEKINKPSPITPSNSLKEKIMGNTSRNKQSSKRFSGDNTLNELLNETAQGDTNTQSALSPVSLAEPFSSGAPMSTDTTGMPESVANAVTRDYSDLMEAINSRKK